jgi:hypothetical protein
MKQQLSEDQLRQVRAAEKVRRAHLLLKDASKLLDGLSWGSAVREVADETEHLAARIKEYGEKGY